MRKAFLQLELKSKWWSPQTHSPFWDRSRQQTDDGPNDEREPSGSKCCVENGAISKQFLPGKNGYDFSYDTHGW